jgi:PhnB protein
MTAPAGWHTLTPRIVTHDARGLVEFLRDVFAATGDLESERPTTLAIGDSNLMISVAGVRAAHPVFAYVYVADADATYRRAVARGAVSIEAPFDTPYGDRRCMIEDAWGNTWQIAVYRPSPDST